LEIKNSSSGTLRKYDGIPPYYFAQIQHQFATTEWKWGYLCFWLDGWKLEPFYIEADPEYLEFLNEEEEKFWVNNVMGNVAPEPKTAKEVDKLYKNAIEGSVIEATTETYELYAEIKNLEAQSHEIKEKLEDKKLVLKKIMKETEALGFGGDILATWKGHTQNFFNQKKFQSDYENLFTKYSNARLVRKFLLK
jgi:predicted phage-related endonuclease